jgi:hypothetical protein
MLLMLPSRLKYLRSLYHIYVYAQQPLPPGDRPLAVKILLLLLLLLFSEQYSLTIQGDFPRAKQYSEQYSMSIHSDVPRARQYYK